MSGPRVVFAHDDRLVLEILRSVSAGHGVEVVGEASTYAGLVQEAAITAPDVVVAADRIGDSMVEDALDALAETGARVIVISADLSPDRPGWLLLQNVAGYLSYDTAPDDVVNGILAVARGETVVTPEVLALILHQWRRFRSQPVALGARRRPVLTPRELDILTAMTDGLGAKAIAAQLGVAIKTVENHKIRIFDKLGVRSHAHAVTVALAYGLARAPEPCP